MPREVKEDNMVKQINNMGAKRVNTMLKELGLESFLINYLSSAHKSDYFPVVYVGEKMAREGRCGILCKTT